MIFRLKMFVIQFDLLSLRFAGINPKICILSCRKEFFLLHINIAFSCKFLFGGSIGLLMMKPRRSKLAFIINEDFSNRNRSQMAKDLQLRLFL